MGGSQIFSIAVMVILVIAIIVTNINWREKAVQWVGNNPVRGQIYMKAGDTVHTVEAVRTLISSDGQFYRYTDTGSKEPVYAILPVDKYVYYENGKPKSIDVIPENEDSIDEVRANKGRGRVHAGYPYYYIRGRRIIGLEDGQLVASPLGFMPPELVSRYKESVTEISLLIESNVTTQALRSVKPAGKPFNWIILGLIVAGVIGYMFYNWYQGNAMPAGQPAGQPADQPPAGAPAEPPRIPPDQDLNPRETLYYLDWDGGRYV